MKKTVIASLVVCAAGASTASAAELGFYIGGYFGQVAKETEREPYFQITDAIHEASLFTPTNEQISFDDKDTAFALIAGYRLNRYLAFEGGYTRLGEVAYKSRATGSFPLDNGLLNTTLESETSGFTVSVLGTLPLTRDWELFARGGVLLAQNRLRLEIVARGEEFVPLLNGADSFAKSTTDTYAGIGISRRILEIYDVRLEYQRVFDAGLEITGGQGDLDAALLGLTVTF
jgi:hypothetical protein